MAASVALAFVAVVSTAVPVGAVPIAPVRTADVPVLMYHRIVEDVPPASTLPGLYVTPEAFDAQLSALWARGWHTITAAALGEAIAARREEPAKTFVISVDDGHADGYTTAWPIMRKYGFMGTFYVVPGHIGRSGFLTWDMAAALARQGNEIANHTMDHVSLPSYHGAALAAQIDDAALAIQDQLATRGVSTTVTTFAYPHGYWSPEAMALLASHGYTLAVTTVSGIGSTLGATRLLYPRVRVSRGEVLATFLANVGGIGPIVWRGAPPAAPAPPALTSRASTQVPFASTMPVAVAAPPSPEASLDTGGVRFPNASLAAPTDAPLSASEGSDMSATTAYLPVVGGLGILIVLLVLTAATLRWRRR
jgi:peptidoglycan/xylan/chitin deacetylase (PgdA/CDA1 family)